MNPGIAASWLRVPPGRRLPGGPDNALPAAFPARRNFFWNPMPHDSGLRFLIDRGDLRKTRLATDMQGSPEAVALQEGQARLAVRRFALTANNVTYAAVGDAMNYWQFFPSDDARWGCLPVWGFAEVVESRAAGVAVGRRVYGFLPAGTHLVVSPERVGERGFVDGTPHRAELAAAYNQLVFCDADPAWRLELEAHQALLRPLFTTSFLIDDFLAAADFFGAPQLLLSSASSKTAWGTAFCLDLRRRDAGLPVSKRHRIVGLTSAANVEYVKALGVYDEVCNYDAVRSLDASAPAVYVDFCGDATLRCAVHEHWGERLAYSCAVGSTHWEGRGSSSGLPGPRPTLFFAPTQYRVRMAPPPQGWGPAGLQQRLSDAWSALLARVAEPSATWLEVQEQRGPGAIEAGYRALLEGRADPRLGLMISW